DISQLPFRGTRSVPALVPGKDLACFLERKRRFAARVLVQQTHVDKALVQQFEEHVTCCVAGTVATHLRVLGLDPPDGLPEAGPVLVTGPKELLSGGCLIELLHLELDCLPGEFSTFD